MNEESDRELLQRFEPVLCFTKGEVYYPMEIEPYVRACSLWVQRPDEEPECLVAEGQLTLEKLSESRNSPFGSVYYLKFIEPLNIAQLTNYQIKKVQSKLKGKSEDEEFRPGSGRLARVGFISRFAAAVFLLSLLARGRVPGDTSTAARIAYRQLCRDSSHYCYYGHVTRENGWIILQYWFFYAFDDWRSGFFGMNDHEADWEQISIYIYRTKTGELQPQWYAYAAHDFSGDDSRRRWDDPEIEKVGEHPVVYVGAGSHASYFARGEYLSEVEMPFLKPMVRFVDRLHTLRVRFLRRYYGDRAGEENRAPFNMFRVPFVDYARGDGLSIGPGQAVAWDEPQVLDSKLSWLTRYRGLWGLYANDPIAGENAPSGPMYNRDGTARQSWFDPLGWAGLGKVSPPHIILNHVLQRQAEVVTRREKRQTTITEKLQELSALGVEAEAMKQRPHLRMLYTEHKQKIQALYSELSRLYSDLASDGAIIEALELYAQQLRAGDYGSARAHLHHPQRPATDIHLRFSHFAEMWSSASIGLLMIALVVLLLFLPQDVIFGLVALISLMVFAEASFRQQLTGLISSIATGLTIVALLVLFYDFFWPVVITAVLITGTYIILENLRELSR